MEQLAVLAPQVEEVAEEPQAEEPATETDAAAA
jgi:hypothetical protein